jgi:preprotein translocase subunit SecA
VSTIIDEVSALNEGMPALLEAKKAEFGETVFKDMCKRLSLQVMDNLWVEHLEVMSYTRASVNLRAYGQRDPLIEYRREGTRLFKEMQQALLVRLGEILPRVQPLVVAKEEAEMKEQAEAAQKAAGEDKAEVTKKQPVRHEVAPGRNDIVTIEKDGKTETVKYKKAEALLAEGWKLVK